MQKTICDLCGSDASGDYSVSIGGFQKQAEILVEIKINKKSGPSGISRWVDVDMCRTCKERALRIALEKLVLEAKLKSVGDMERYLQA